MVNGQRKCNHELKYCMKPYNNCQTWQFNIKLFLTYVAIDIRVKILFIQSTECSLWKKNLYPVYTWISERNEKYFKGREAEKDDE